MHDFTLPEEADDVVDIGVIRETQDVVIGRACLLFGAHILGEIGDNVALDSDRSGGPGSAAGKLGIDPCGVIDKIGIKARFFDFFDAHIAGQLMHQRTYHLQMAQFFRTCRSIGNGPHIFRRCRSGGSVTAACRMNSG